MTEPDVEKTKDGTAGTAGDSAADAGKKTGDKVTTGSGTPESGTADVDTPATEIGGRGGPDPTRFGDWEIAGRCVDF